MKTQDTQMKLAALAEKYAVTNATGTHGKVRPWLLTEDERSIETLERIRRCENLLVRIADSVGAERNHKQGPGTVTSEVESAADKPRGLLAALLGHGI